MEEKIQKLKEEKQRIEYELKKMENKEKPISKKANKLIRVDTEFDKNLQDTINQRYENNLDERPLSKPKVTKLINKHKSLWNDLRNVDLKKPLGKKGQMSIYMLYGLFLVLFVIIYFFVFGTAVVKINEAFDQNISLGQVNLQEINAQTFGVFATSVMNNADFWGLAAIFGMVLGLFLASYFMRNKMPKIVIIFDIFIIMAVFIFSLYLRGIYSSLINALASSGETFLEIYMSNTSKFMLNLPIFVVIIGTIMAILFHSSIPKKSEETSQQGGTFQALGG